MRAVDQRVVDAAEALADAIAAQVAQTSVLARREPALTGRWGHGRIVRAVEAVAAPWLDYIPFPRRKPIPFRPPEVRARFADGGAMRLTEFLPLPEHPNTPQTAMEA